MSSLVSWSAIRVSIALVFTVPIVSFAIFVRRYPDDAWNFGAILVLFVALFAVAAGAVVWHITTRLRRLARTQSAATRAEGLRVALSAEALETHSRSIANVVRWRAFDSVRTTKKNLVLRLRTGGTVPIPLRYLDESTRRMVLTAVRTGESPSAGTDHTSRA
ncbi:MAG: YcxB family protein [Candidatus Eremiobacteraeota bacterium]|nr:YcxB family protein [Candidatus Eremiobacteraeota bacterium]